MRDILGTTYMSDKEAAQRYGYSESWFRKRRKDQIGPPFMRLTAGGKVWYPVKESDDWFQKNMIRDE